MTKRSNYDIWHSVVDEMSISTGSGDGGDMMPPPELKSPSKIVAELDRTVIGQTEAKQLIAIAAWNRLLSQYNHHLGRYEEEDYYFEKNNILLVGNTGCGKTHLMRALSRAVSAPVTIQDATTFTSAGYVGRDINECISDLSDEAYRFITKNHDISMMTPYAVRQLCKRAIEHGIVYVDEADKIKACATTSGKDVNGRSVQEAFLRLVEGTTIRVTGGSYYGEIDTSNILFIFGGAFSGMQKIVKSRSENRSMGFAAEMQSNIKEEETIRKATIADFTAFGIIPELMGRLSTIAALKPMDRDMIYRIFTEPDRSIMSQVINEFRSYGAEVAFSGDAIDYIVDEALALKLGARGLKSVTQRMLRPLHYHMPDKVSSKKIVITKAMLQQFEEK